MTFYKYFKEEEVKGLAPALVQMLDKAREVAKIPFVITSGFRTDAENSAVGGVADSSHLKGLAVDLRCRGNQDRFKIVKGLLDAGFIRIICYIDHIHADIDTSKIGGVMIMQY